MTEPDALAPRPTKDEFRAALAAFVREEMPWPFADVSRHDNEGIDTAWEIAMRLESAFHREFAAIAETARAVRRRTYPASQEKEK